MAYLDIDNYYSSPVTTTRSTEPVQAARAGFSGLEWSVIALAERDGLRSLATPGRLSRAMGSLFGIGTASRLADPQLETLRRLAVYAWRRGFAIPQREIDRFLAAGFTEAQIETLVVSVTGMSVSVSATRARAA